MVGWEQHIMVEESLSLESNQRFQLCLYPRSIVQFGLSFHKATGHWGTEDRPVGRWGIQRRAGCLGSFLTTQP